MRMESYYCTRLSTLVVFIAVKILLFWLLHEQIRRLIPWLVSTDLLLAISIFFVLFIVVSLPTPIPGYLILNVAAGFRFGLPLGAAVVIVCAASTAFCSFTLCRLTCTSYLLHRIQSDYFQAIISLVGGEHSFKLIALTRLTPIPFGLQNGVFAMSKVSTCTFVLATLVGLLPNQLLSSYIGSTLRSFQDITNQHWNKSLAVILQVCLVVALAGYIILKARTHLQQKIHVHTLSAEDPEIECRTVQEAAKTMYCRGRDIVVLESDVISHRKRMLFFTW